MSYQSKSAWNKIAQEVLKARQNGCSVEFNAAYSFVNEATLRRIAGGKVHNPKKETQDSLCRLMKKARQFQGYYGQQF